MGRGGKGKGKEEGEREERGYSPQTSIPGAATAARKSNQDYSVIRGAPTGNIFYELGPQLMTPTFYPCDFEL